MSRQPGCTAVVAHTGSRRSVALHRDGGSQLARRAPRPLGNPTRKAWLAGWDAAVAGYSYQDTPYRRAPQVRAWQSGWVFGRRSDAAAVRQLQYILTQG